MVRQSMEMNITYLIHLPSFCPYLGANLLTIDSALASGTGVGMGMGSGAVDESPTDASFARGNTGNVLGGYKATLKSVFLVFYYAFLASAYFVFPN